MNSEGMLEMRIINLNGSYLDAFTCAETYDMRRMFLNTVI